MIHKFVSDSPTAIQDIWQREASPTRQPAFKTNGKEKIFKKKMCELGPLAQTLRHEDVHIELIAYIYHCLKQLPIWDWPEAF